MLTEIDFADARNSFSARRFALAKPRLWRYGVAVPTAGLRQRQAYANANVGFSNSRVTQL
jgi:hypothetical protein